MEGACGVRAQSSKRVEVEVEVEVEAEGDFFIFSAVTR
jgi:hypothetical protein